MIDKITEIQKLKLHENEVLIAKLPVGNIPRSAWRRQADELGQVLRTMLLSNNIIVIADDIDFTVIKKEHVKHDHTEHF